MLTVTNINIVNNRFFFELSDETHHVMWIIMKPDCIRLGITVRGGSEFHHEAILDREITTRDIRTIIEHSVVDHATEFGEETEHASFDFIETNPTIAEAVRIVNGLWKS